MDPEDIDTITWTLRGGSDDARAEALAALYAAGERAPGALEELLATTYFEGVTVAAWSGALLLRRPDIDEHARMRLLVRVLPGLVDQVDDAAAEAFVAAFGAVSPRAVYDLAGDIVGLDDGTEVERRYAYGVLTAFDWQRLTDDARTMAGRSDPDSSGPMSIELEVAPWVEVAASWPASGRHVLAQFDATGIWLFQAYRAEIADEAVRHQRLGGPPGGEAASLWRADRMSWVKPGFQWMMHRAGWATKKHQERILALYVSRASFDAALERAVASSVGGSAAFADAERWRQALDQADVVVQWDPDRTPSDRRLQRRAVQLGLRREILARVVQDEVMAVRDITPFVQREAARRDSADVRVPRAAVYPVLAPGARERLGLDDAEPHGVVAPTRDQ